MRSKAPTLTGVTHEIKADAAVFEASFKWLKNYELRFNDRDYQVGDMLKIRETQFTGAEMKAGAPLIYTDRAINREIAHVLRGPAYGLADGWVILAWGI